MRVHHNMYLRAKHYYQHEAKFPRPIEKCGEPSEILITSMQLMIKTASLATFSLVLSSFNKSCNETVATSLLTFLF